ncbi:MAG: hypothetical protein IT209_09285 [Armatimonadetes bacterium]|nr:hypothetical protein [Armatimonadota bacterium]
MTIPEEKTPIPSDGSRSALAGALLVVLAVIGTTVLRAGAPDARATATRAHTRTFSATQPSTSYPFGSQVFSDWVQQSYDENGGGNREAFFSWFDKAWGKANVHLGKNVSGTPLGQLKAAGDALKAIPSVRRTQSELALCRAVHRAVKTTIPLFSLERGFEFSNVPTEYQRQCFLQSVLISGMLQRAGLDAGVVMVWKNPEGQTSNNGHAASLVRLSNGGAVIVDASEKQPFARHQGLYGLAGYPVFVRPDYAPGQDIIRSYQAQRDARRLPVTAFAGMNRDFISSQFNYYRGERAPGGILSSAPTAAGLTKSAHFLQKAVRQCPSNSLAVYLLGRVYARQGHRDLAAHCFDKAMKSYERSGWLPDGPRQAARTILKSAGS